MLPSPPHHQIERTRNRNSRAILKDETIIIRLARGLSASEETRHIDALLTRMVKAKARNVQRTLIDPFRALLEGAETVDVQGVLGPVLSLRVVKGETLRSKKCAEYIHVVRPENIDAKRFHRFLWNILSRHCSTFVDEYVRLINTHTLGASILSVNLKFMRSRWGSCSPSGVIALSTPLLCTSESILRYVIIHELCHTRHPDHSARFWHSVEQYEPGYREIVKELQALRLPSC
jgi:predicted metal-dependent hydrolase